MAKHTKDKEVIGLDRYVMDRVKDTVVSWEEVLDIASILLHRPVNYLVNNIGQLTYPPKYYSDLQKLLIRLLSDIKKANIAINNFKDNRKSLQQQLAKFKTSEKKKLISLLNLSKICWIDELLNTYKALAEMLNQMPSVKKIKSELNGAMAQSTNQLKNYVHNKVRGAKAKVDTDIKKNMNDLEKNDYKELKNKYVDIYQFIQKKYNSFNSTSAKLSAFMEKIDPAPKKAKQQEKPKSSQAKPKQDKK